ncbi:MAG: PrgI family protein [Candidatus Pacebacteria bacterium]|nr:PrgI family protein [Candidatus Paceibacterota bacterium]
MQFKVPQFLDIEDKIFGPFTFKEFAYLAGGAGICFVLFKWLGLLVGAIPILIMAGISAALTFYRPNGKPLIFTLESGFKFFAKDRLYIWKKSVVKKKTAGQSVENEGDKIKMMSQGEARLSGSKLRDLAWSLDVLDLSKDQKRQL